MLPGPSSIVALRKVGPLFRGDPLIALSIHLEFDSPSHERKVTKANPSPIR